MCCDVCCKEFKGWCRAFTKTERALTILEVVLLALLLIFLIFLILHFLACTSSNKDKDYIENLTEYPETKEPVPKTEKLVTNKQIKHLTTTKYTVPSTAKTKTTIDPELECSWTPSAKTTALIRYFEDGATKTNKPTISLKHIGHTTVDTTSKKAAKDITLDQDVDFIQSDQSDGEDAENIQNKYILALVKLKPPQNIVFGCILTIISQYWVLTSASCIEAIEEVDSLDSFVIMEEYGSSSKGKICTIFDLQIHPFYQGVNKSYDLAALKSESSFERGQAVQLPTALDFSMITIGERFNILGFGAYRSIDKSATGRSLRKVYVYRLPSLACPGSEPWSTRHLEAGRALGPAPCRLAPVCAGVLFARGLPCNYCSGTPLLRHNLLLGLMTDNQQCGVACEPQLYVNIAAVRDWIESVKDK